MPSSRPARRIFLGKRRAFMGEQRTYRAPDYLEIDDVEGYDVTRRRIFYDEIVLVTLHASVGWGLVVSVGLLGALLSLLTLALLRESATAAAVVFALGGLPMLTLAVLLVARPFETVSVFGKRTRTQMHFWLRSNRARQTYLLVCRLARERQAQTVAQPAAAEASLAPSS